MEITQEQLGALIDERVAQVTAQKRPLTEADKALKESGDINKVHVPYRFQPYPKHLFSQVLPAPDGESQAGLHFIEVQNAGQEQEALQKGWSLTAPVRPFVAPGTILEAPTAIPDAPAGLPSPSHADTPAASTGRAKARASATV